MPYVALSKSAAQSLIEEHSAVLEGAKNEYSVERIIYSLEQKVQNLERIALQAYSALGVSGGSVESIEKQLTQRIIKLQSETASLNGINLQSCFLQALKEAEGFQLDYSKELDELQQYFMQETGSNLVSGEVATLLLNEIGQGIKNFIPQQISFGSTGKAYNTATGTFAIDLTKPYTKLSSRAKEIFNSYSKKKKQGLINSVQPQSSSINGHQFTQQYLVDTFGVESLLKMKPEERTRVFQQYPQLKDLINRRFIQQIVNSCNASDKVALTKCIEEILRQKPLAFFVGGNIEGMTGILGEIQGFYFFRMLLNNPNANVSWIGGLGNPHADLLLTQGLQQFGIQIKNTSQDVAELEVGFQSFGATKGRAANQVGAIYQYENTSEAMSVLAAMAPLSLVESISTFLAMEGFNIQYQWDASTKSAKQVESNPDFESVRAQIELYSEYAQKIASLFAVSMMYMQETTYSGGYSNTLYLIGGITLVSAATILKNIVQQLKGALARFKMNVEGHSAGKGLRGVKTIVDVINEKGHLSDTKFMMQSSYTFGL